MSGRKANLTIALEDKPGQLERVEMCIRDRACCRRWAVRAGSAR